MKHLLQMSSILVGLMLIFCVSRLMVKKRISEIHAIVWLVTGFLAIVVSLYPKSIIYISNYLGIDYAPSTLFTIAILVLVVLVFNFTVVISSLSMQVQELAMQVSLLNMESRELQDKIAEYEVKQNVLQQERTV